MAERRIGVWPDPDLDPANRALDRPLASTSRVAGIEMTLADVLDWLADAAGVAIVPDWRALDDVRVQPSTAAIVSRQARTGRQVLEGLIGGLTTWKPVDYCVWRGVVVVAPMANLSPYTATRVYDIRPLLPPAEPLGPMARVYLKASVWDKAAATGLYGGPEWYNRPDRPEDSYADPGDWSLFGDDDDDPYDPREAWDDADMLRGQAGVVADWIKHAVRAVVPAACDETPQVIAELDGLLVVRQPAALHRRTRRMLDGLVQASAATAPPARPARRRQVGVRPADDGADAGRRAARRLAQPVEAIRFEQASLEDAFGFFAETAGTALQVDWDELAMAGVDVSQRVSLSLRQVPGDQALALILSRLGQNAPDAHRLGYTVDGQGLSIASEASLRRRSIVRRYEIGGLVEAMTTLAVPAKRDLLQIADEVAGNASPATQPAGVARVFPTAERRRYLRGVLQQEQYRARVGTLLHGLTQLIDPHGEKLSHATWGPPARATTLVQIMDHSLMRFDDDGDWWALSLTLRGHDLTVSAEPLLQRRVHWLLQTLADARCDWRPAPGEAGAPEPQKLPGLPMVIETAAQPDAEEKASSLFERIRRLRETMGDPPAARPVRIGPLTFQAGRVAYVVDTSGSMLDGFDALRDALIASIQVLDDDQEFNVVRLTSHVGGPRSWQFRPAWATQANRGTAVDLCWQLVPAGKGMPHGAMQLALAMRPDAVVLIGDGDYPEDLPDRVREWNKRRVPLFIVACEPDKDGEALLRQLAADSGGEYRDLGTVGPTTSEATTQAGKR